jgi:hypothetical protein
MVFASNDLHNSVPQPTGCWKFLARHSSQIEKISLKDFVNRAERSPLSSPTSSSLLQFVYGFCDKSCTFWASNFLRCRYFFACFRNSGAKYAL